MNHKIRSTLTGVLVAVSFVISGGILGNAPINNMTANSNESNVPSTEADVTAANTRSQRVRRHINMPYFSFGNVFPK